MSKLKCRLQLHLNMIFTAYISERRLCRIPRTSRRIGDWAFSFAAPRVRRTERT